MTDELEEQIRNRTSSAGVTPVPMPLLWCMASMQIMRVMMAQNIWLASYLRKQ